MLRTKEQAVWQAQCFVARKDAQIVTPEWQAKVRKALDEMPRGAYTRLAKFVGISTGQISELLAERDREARWSRFVPKVNQFLGWSTDTNEVNHLVDVLGADAKDALLALRDMSPEQRKAAIGFMRTFAKPANDQE